MDPRKILLEKLEKELCFSTREYKRVLGFLRQNRVMVLNERVARQVADKVSEGCDGAAERFEKTLILMKTVGLSDRKSLELGLEFSMRDPEVQQNFLEIFNRSFLSEFFDHDYETALNLAYELSKDYKGDPVNVRRDFIALARFCRDGAKLDLPNKLCGELAVKLARLSQFYPEGVTGPFFSLYNNLRNKEQFAFNIKSALDVSYNVLKAGPRAEQNFMEAYEYAIDQQGLGVTKDNAIQFALQMAQRSHRGEEPPVIPAEIEKAEMTHAANNQ